MINYLKDCQQTTLIGQLPDIINSNNESIKNEFNWIFDSSLNRLTKSVYAPTGSVKSHFGEFTNLACEYITIKNIDSLIDVMTINSSLNHNLLTNRFYNSSFNDLQNFTHDASSIIYKIENNEYVTVNNQLDFNDTSIKKLINNINNIQSDVNNIQRDVNNAQSVINEEILPALNNPKYSRQVVERNDTEIGVIPNVCNDIILGQECTQFNIGLKVDGRLNSEYVNEVTIRINCVQHSTVVEFIDSSIHEYAWPNFNVNSVLFENTDIVNILDYNVFELNAVNSSQRNDVNTIYEIKIRYNSYYDDSDYLEPRYTISFKRFSKLHY